jgi:cellulose synthase/poly-beta-1,6-N-acetylglucosamine synthase-like glycosyltransferase
MSARQEAARRIGDILLDAGLVTPAQVGEAVALQRTEGGMLGRHLILTGAVSRREMYAALAEQWDAPFVDMLAEPATAMGLLQEGDPRRFAELGWVPWRLDGTTLTIATAVTPDEEVLASAAALPGVDRVEVRTTTDWDVLRTVQDAGRDRLLYRITDGMADERPEASARSGMSRWQKIVPLLAGLVFIATLPLAPSVAVVAGFCVANLLFTINIAFKVLAGMRAPVRLWQKRRWHAELDRARRRRGLPTGAERRLSDEDLPVYTILVPVYDEVEVIAKVIANLDRLDYPKSKLDVMVLLEESDVRTIEAAKRTRPPEYVRIVVVPAGDPQTKPRACNYGLEFARGEYVVIFDAEDRPRPDQLRRALDAFEMNRRIREQLDPREPRLVCVQASLMYFNADYNLLTRMFAIEYAHWFDMMLPGLDDSGLPLPLGGTSNHFETRMLRDLGGWDPYNVTEDADLGLRIASQGLAVGTIETATEEEATSEVSAWIRQRTRWIKGYMITAAVNTRHVGRWYRVNGIGGLMTMACLVLGTPLAFMAYPFAWLFTVTTYIGIATGGLHFPRPVLVTGLVLMVLGNGTMILSSAIAAWRRYNWRVAVYAPLNPVYWILHSVAAWRAAYQLVFDPFRWEKTPHGLTADYESEHELRGYPPMP